MKTTAAIFGVGLIGGSLALCLKNTGTVKVVGHSPRESSVSKYLERGVVDEATTSFEEAALQADFIFLCVPVGSLAEYMDRLSKLQLKSGCIISDVGSTKASVAECARVLTQKDVCFIGGHPMAGSERSGVESASLHLFENAYYVLTPTEETPQKEITRLTELLACTKARIVHVDAAAHDEIVGAVSHLPHIVAVALVNQVRQLSEREDLYRQLAAGGFRDITRIAAGEPVIWRDILIDNRKVLLQLLADWQSGIQHFVELLENEDGAGIEQAFEEAGAFRSRMPERRKGMILSSFDCYVDVPDHPGIIGSIAGLLGDNKVNLSNMQIIETREDVPGTMRLSFRTQEMMDAAISVLVAAGYKTHQ